MKRKKFEPQPGSVFAEIKKKADKKARNRFTVFVTVCLVFAVIVTCYITVIFSTLDYFSNEALAIAGRQTSESTEAVSHNAYKYVTTLEGVAKQFSSVSGTETADILNEDALLANGYVCVQFLHGSDIVESFGNTVIETPVLLARYIFSRESGFSAFFIDKNTGERCVAIYCPVQDSNEYDGLVAVVPLKSVFINKVNIPELEMSVFAEADGTILGLDSYGDTQSYNNTNYFDLLMTMTSDKKLVDEITADVSKGIYKVYKIFFNGENYFISLSRVSIFDAQCFVVNTYNAVGLTESEFPLYNRLIASAVSLVMLTIIIFMAFIVIRFRNRTQKIVFEDVDAELGCSTFNKFSRDAEDILLLNLRSNYAVVYFNINRYSYLNAAFGDDVLRYVDTVVKKSISSSETYGHVNDENFVMLLHYANIPELTARLKMMVMLASNYAPAKAENYSISLEFGIYCVDRSKKYTIKQMFERAIIAHKSNRSTVNKPYVIYDSSIRAKYLREAEISSMAEAAYKKKEFKVFYQPKYNIQQDVVDGAEALVRWYNPQTSSYILPEEFISVFELSRFITKLDRYVFVEVCKNMQEADDRGEKVIPISVNVSRVTAMEHDFLSFYIDKKKEYKIPNGFLTIEFTESFAYENFEAINAIVTSLRSNGFGCSIDDFGSGYSSFSLLKELKMDELKLDRLFLEGNEDEKHDEYLIEVMVSLGKHFNMKVTQEGIETKEQLEMLKKYGCDVIQGFYYSKPLPLSDFIDFVNRSTTMNSVIKEHQRKL